MGGEGYGFAELAVVVEELGRALAPGPFLPTVLGERGDPGRRGSEGAARATGQRRRRSAPSRSAPPVAADGRRRRMRSCSGHRVARAVRVARRRPRGAPPRPGTASAGAWSTVTPSTRHRLESLDPTRRVAEVAFDGVVVAAGDQLPTPRPRDGRAARAHPRRGRGRRRRGVVRRHRGRLRRRIGKQFGRPIGQFQGVKHRCADMLVALEQARARGLGRRRWPSTARARRPPRPALVASAAGAIALDAFARIAKDCIQVLGGIGFTWEHDAHLYLRRAIALRQLLGGAGPWRAEAADVARSPATRRHLTPRPARRRPRPIRAEVAALVDEIAAAARRRSAGPPLADAGLIVPHWAPPWGRDADRRRAAGDRRGAAPGPGPRAPPPGRRRGRRRPSPPTARIEQQERWVGPTLLGEITWCQLFSEPEAGSDLAALTTTGTRTDGGWLLNGQKVWTTMAKEADWGICLVRTNPTAPKHLGITYFDRRHEGARASTSGRCAR